MASSNHWTSSFQVGSHHLARGFVEAGWDVAYISSPISPVHLLGGVNQELKERIAIYWLGGYQDPNGNLWAYVPGALLTPHNKPILRSEWIHQNWAKLTWPNVVTKIVKAGFGKVDLLYIDNVLQAFWLDVLSYKKSVFRIADKNIGFERSTPAMQKLEKKIAGSVDIVIYAAKQLANYVCGLHPKQMLHVPNGVFFNHFAQGDRSLPIEYKTIDRPIAVYVGAIDVWFDFELLNQVATRLPHVSFVLIGSDEVARAKLRKRPNIHIIGRRPYSTLPSYLHNADVGIIPFNTAEYPELVSAIHPLKLYEYLACGLPVVATEWAELKSLESPAILCQGVEQFACAVNEAILKPRDKESYINYAAKQDWSERIKILLEYLEITSG